MKFLKEKGNWILNSADRLVFSINNDLLNFENSRWKYNNKKMWDKGGFLPYWNINKKEILEKKFNEEHPDSYEKLKEEFKDTSYPHYHAMKELKKKMKKLEDIEKAAKAAKVGEGTISNPVLTEQYIEEAKILKNALDPTIKYYHWYGDFKVETCSDMFDRIFGTDPNPGTMSAGLLKESIFNEIINMYKIDNNVLKHYLRIHSGLEEKDFNNNVLNNDKLKNDFKYNEFKSAVALVVFKLLMTTSKKIKNIKPKSLNKENIIEEFVNDYSFADLLLHDNVHFCKAIEIASDTPNIETPVPVKGVSNTLMMMNR